MSTPLTNDEIIRRRQIIQYAFADELSPQQIQQAITLWDRIFYDSPVFISKFVQFTKLLTNELNLPTSHQLRLTAKLMKNFTLLKDSSIELPLMNTEEQTTMISSGVVFNSILSEIIHYLKQQHAEDISLFKQYLSEEIPQLELTSEIEHALLTWCHLIGDEDFIIRQELTEEQMALFIDLLYEELCGLLGAKETDLLFSVVVTQCDKIPQAKSFSPHNLI